jgi:hypothetical protein
VSLVRESLYRWEFEQRALDSDCSVLRAAVEGVGATRTPSKTDMLPWIAIFAALMLANAEHLRPFSSAISR